MSEMQNTAGEAADALLLFTDWQANEGIVEPTAIVEQLKLATASMLQSPAVYTFGFGADHNATLLQRIAESTQGSYYYVKDSSVLKDSFADCLGGLISITLSSISVKFWVADASTTTVDKVMTKYPSSTTDDKAVTIRIKDMYSSEVRDIPLKLKVNTNAASAGCRMQLIRWTVSYLSAVDNAEHTHEESTAVDISESVFAEAPNLYVDEQRNRFMIGEALEVAKQAAEAQNFEKAKEIMSKVQMDVLQTHSAQTRCMLEMQEEVTSIQAQMSSIAYAQGGSQQMNACASRHQTQRCNDASDTAMYQTSWKCAMKKK